MKFIQSNIVEILNIKIRVSDRDGSPSYNLKVASETMLTLNLKIFFNDKRDRSIRVGIRY
jgi:hypothetical protein